MSDVTVLRVYGSGSDGVITFQTNKLEELSTPFPLWSLVTRKRVIWENHKLSMMRSLSLSLCLFLSLALSPDVNSGRMLFQPSLPLDCFSVCCGLAMTLSPKRKRAHWMPQESFFFLYNYFLVIYFFLFQFPLYLLNSFNVINVTWHLM